MRDIEYRGVSWEAEWVYGDLIKGERQYISTPELFKDAVVSLSGRVSTKIIPIDPESVGQFTGLLDAKGNKVFEGDWLRVGDDAFIGLVVFDGDALVWSCDVYTLEGEKIERMTLVRFVYSRELAVRDGLEVIGNHYQHPYLIKGDE